jgi:TRAP-type mannitol/chloroaromatic compound transport system permease small subunit
MDGLKAVLDAIDRFNQWIGKCLSLLILAIFVLIMVEVVRRYLLNSPTVWANELTQYLFGAYIVLSGGHILASGGHVNVDLLFARLSRKTQARLDIFTSFLFFIFCSMLIYYGGALAWESLAIFETSQSAWDAPIYPVKLMIPVGAGLLLIQGLAKLIRDILVVTGRETSAGKAPQDKETL